MAAKYNLDHVKMVAKEKGFTILEEEYVGVFHKMKVMCKKKHITEKTFDKITQGRGCIICSGLKKYTIEDAREIFKKEEFAVVSEEIVDVRTPLDVICKKNHRSSMRLDNFMRGKRCLECYRERNIGENHRNWNEEITDEQREKGRNTQGYKKWREAVYERDSKTCQRCQAKDVIINAHHIRNYTIERSKRMDVNNGICLCTPCHNEFHYRYGLRNNDEDQLKEFMGDLRNEKY